MALRSMAPSLSSLADISGRIGGASTGLLNDVLSFVFPPECVVCEKRLADLERYYCDACRDLAEDLSVPLCPSCRSGLLDLRRGCSVCRGCSPISALWACGVFDRFYRPIVHAVKYQGLLPIARMMAGLLASRISESIHRPIIDLLVPVPLHWTRKRERGFNQSLIIACELASRLGLPVAKNALRRVRKTLDQTGLSAQARITNVKGAFRVREFEVLARKRVLLVDDVTTTGATLNEAAGELRKAGCRNVFAAVIAVASYGK